MGNNKNTMEMFFILTIVSTVMLIVRILMTGRITYLFFLWIAIIIWTAKDIISRTNNLGLQILSIALTVIMNIFGLLIYLAIRPSKTLIAKFFEDLEYEALVEEANRTTWEQEKQNKKQEKVQKKTKKKANKDVKKNKKITKTEKTKSSKVTAKKKIKTTSAKTKKQTNKKANKSKKS